LAGGDMQEIVNMDESATKFAKANGCSALTIAGRRGWKKVLSEKISAYDNYKDNIRKQAQYLTGMPPRAARARPADPGGKK